MKKPEDVTQEDWNAAEQALDVEDTNWDRLTQTTHELMHLSVARSIVEARKNERAECARIAYAQAPATQDFADAPLQELAGRIAKKILSRSKAKEER